MAPRTEYTTFENLLVPRNSAIYKEDLNVKYNKTLFTGRPVEITGGLHKFLNIKFARISLESPKNIYFLLDFQLC